MSESEPTPEPASRPDLDVRALIAEASNYTGKVTGGEMNRLQRSVNAILNAPPMQGKAALLQELNNYGEDERDILLVENLAGYLSGKIIEARSKRSSE